MFSQCVFGSSVSRRRPSHFAADSVAAEVLESRELLSSVSVLDAEIAGTLGEVSLADVSAESTDASYSLNQAVLGRSDLDNTLKGMSVVVDAAADRVYVTGIMTDDVAVIDLSTGELSRTFQLPDHGQATKKLAFDDVHRELWAVTNKQEPTIWIADPDDGSLIASRNIGDDLRGATRSYPIKDLALDSFGGRLYLAVSDVSGSRVAVYDRTLSEVDSLLEGREVVSIAWDESTGSLLALSARTAAGATGEIFVLSRGEEAGLERIGLDIGSSDRLPAELAVDETGGLYVAGSRTVWKIDSVTGEASWSALLPFTATALDVSGSEVGVLHKYSDADSSTVFVSQFTTLNRDTGEWLATREARYEASRMDVHPDSGQFVVGNGGDASVSVFGAGRSEGVHVKVGSAAEDVLITPDGNRLLALNRLGGSQLIEFDMRTGASRVVETVAWPVRMAAFEETNSLFIFSHFEPLIEVRDLETLELVDTISLAEHGVTASYSDTLSDMSFASDGSLLVALQAEQGLVVVVDSASREVLAVTDLGGRLPGDGPGRLNAAVDISDPADRTVFVYLEDDSRLYRLRESDGFAASIEDSTEVSVDREVQGAYGFRSVFLSTGSGGESNTVYVWNVAVDAETLEVGESIDGVERFVGESDGVLIGQHKVSSGVNAIESLVVVDASTGAVLHEQELAETEAMDAKVDLDLESGRVAFTMPAVSEVHMVELEYDFEVLEEAPGLRAFETRFDASTGVLEVRMLESGSLSVGSSEGRFEISGGDGVSVSTRLVPSAGVHGLEIIGTDGSDSIDLSGIRGRDLPLLNSVSVSAGGGDDRLQGSPLADVLRGGEGSDRVNGSGGDDVLDGGSGDDTLRGGAGRDILRGRMGDDRLIGQGGVDRVEESAEADLELGDTYLVGRGRDWLSSIEQAVLVAGDVGHRLDARGFSHAVTLLGGAGEDVLLGGASSDHLDGGRGADVLIGGDGRDRLNGRAGDDTILGGAGDDTMLGGAGRDLMLGGLGDDLLRGHGGLDTLVGGPGSDDIRGSEREIDELFVLEVSWLSEV
jgi:Ca2+-binding RTX toxin-like protein